MTSLRFLLLEDNPLDADVVRVTLSSGEIESEIAQVETQAAFVAALESDRFDLILADYALPGFDGLAALELAKELAPEIPFIFVSGSLGEDLAIEALKYGATDYVLKHNLRRLVPCVERALREAQETQRLKQSVAKLHESEQQYRSLFESIDQGFCLLEVLFDANDKAIDYRFVEINQAFEQQSGLANAVGKTILELVPNLEPQWAELYGQVAKSGKAVRFEADAPSMNRIFDIYAFPSGTPGQNLVAVLFADITQRRRAEEILRRTAELGTFRVSLADALRPLTNASEIQAIAARILGEALRATRVVYIEVVPGSEEVIVHRNYTNGVAELSGHYRLEDYGRNLIADHQAGRTQIVTDIPDNPRYTDAETAILILRNSCSSS